jgi:hypothetical protein
MVDISNINCYSFIKLETSVHENSMRGVGLILTVCLDDTLMGVENSKNLRTIRKYVEVTENMKVEKAACFGRLGRQIHSALPSLPLPGELNIQPVFHIQVYALEHHLAGTKSGIPLWIKQAGKRLLHE